MNDVDAAKRRIERALKTVYMNSDGEYVGVQERIRKDDVRIISAELDRLRADAESARRGYNLASSDLQIIANALDIGAKPYSGHEAMERDILPEIRRLKQIEAVYESIVTRKIPQSYLGNPQEPSS